jgi:Fe-S oxidoreductase
LLGFSYAIRAPKEAHDAILSAVSLLRAPVALVDRCCGLPLLLAGDEEGFSHAARGMALRLERYERLVVVDPGCAQTIRQRYAQRGAKVGASVQTLVELASENLELIGQVRQRDELPVRYHDSCQLGRGLGVYEAPRAILRKILGRACDEFSYAKELAYCCGAGGLLPVVEPETAKGIARARVAEHESLGGGRIVTACGSSFSMLKKAGGKVEDISTWIARAVRPWEDGSQG